MEPNDRFSSNANHQAIVYDMLCDSCEDFLGRPEVLVSSMVTRTRAHHWPNRHNVPAAKIHSSFADMKTSAHNGCHLCTLILASFGPPVAGKTIPDGSLILAELWRFPDSLGQNMASVAVWPTGTRDDSGMSVFFRKFSISHLSTREKNNILARRATSTAKLSQESLSQIKSWLAFCCKDHSTCRDSWTLVSEQRRMPTRLLEITQLSGQWRLRIIDGLEVQLESTYLTLSHCWGSSDFVRLTSENHRSYKDDLPYESLPQTFQDAVGLTFALGFNYLWIDSLCIVQDSHGDWAHESSMMGSVYAQGCLNIAATYSQNCDGGLFNQSKMLSASPCIIQMIDDDGASAGATFYQDSVWHREVETAPLGKRGWVVQERVLAPRIIHFSQSQSLWECCQKRAAELLPADAVGEDGELKKVTPYAETSEAEDPDRMWVHSNWASLVEKYSSCSLTVQSDKLVAISGLARRTCGQLGLTPKDYVAGLWTSNLIYGLLYSVLGASKPVRFPDRAPSWSWASINGDVIFFPQDRANLSQWTYTSVLDTQTYHNGDPFGQLQGGCIRLRGPLAELPNQSSLSEMSHKSAPKEAITFTATTSGIFFDESPSQRQYDPTPLYFLLLVVDSKIDEPAVVHGLLLRSTGRKRGQFERIGVWIHGEVGNFELSLKNAKDPKRLDERLYLEADLEKGFTVEIV